MILTIPTANRRQVIDLTDILAEQSRGKSGHLSIMVLHSTAAITTANLDAGTDLDLLDALAGMLPQLQWRHEHNPAHAPDHLLASIVGPSIVVPVQEGELQVGTWQRIVLLEFKGPRECHIDVSFIGAREEPTMEL